MIYSNIVLTIICLVLYDTLYSILSILKDMDYRQRNANEYIKRYM